MARAEAFIDIKMLGDKELERALAKLPAKNERFAVRPALQKSAKRTHAEVIKRLSGHPVTPRSGRLLAAMTAMKPKLLKGARGFLGYVLGLPTRDQLDIDPADKWFYPAIVEYGHPRAAPRSYLRAAVDDNLAAERTAIAADIGRGIRRQWARLNKR